LKDARDGSRIDPMLSFIDHGDGVGKGATPNSAPTESSGAARLRGVSKLEACDRFLTQTPDAQCVSTRSFLGQPSTLRTRLRANPPDRRIISITRVWLHGDEQSL